MANLFAFLFLISFLVMLVGLVVPSLIGKIFKREFTRKKILMVFGGIALASFVLIGILGDKKANDDVSKSVTAPTPTTIAELAKVEVTSVPTNVPATVISLSPSEKPLPTIKPTSTTKPTPTLTESQIIDKSMADYAKDATAVTVKDIDKTPNSYLMKKIVFKCKVLGFAKDKSGDIGGINCSDPSNYSAIIQLGTVSLFDFTRINEGDTLQIYGLGYGSATGTNAFGAEISMGIVNVVYLKDLTTGYKE